MLKMGTRAASFSAKIRNLQDYHHRLLNGITPYPSIPDLINVLKFFSQALLTILRDVPCIPIDLIRDPMRDQIRIGFFPNLDYRNLFFTLSNMIDSYGHIQQSLSSNAPIIFEYLLHSLVCLVPFLEHELMDSMPLIVANTISLNFISHQDIIDMLCYNILPFTLYNKTKDNEYYNFANQSIPSILMIVLSHTDSLALHSQLLECLMRLKSNIIQDLLIVIAYGTGKARHASVELLFQYWPGLNPSPTDRKHLAEKHCQWKPLTCQNDTCQNSLNNEAVKICFTQIDTTLSNATSGGQSSGGNVGSGGGTGGGQSSGSGNTGGGGGGGQSSAGGGGGGGGGGQTASGMTALPASIDLKGRPPIPLLICIECAESVREQNSLNKSIKSQDILLNVLHPMSEISYTCESKSCLGQQQQQQQQQQQSSSTSGSRTYHHYIQQHHQQQLQPAVVTCFSTECTSFNCNKPVRLCQQCHEQRHGVTTIRSVTPTPNTATTTNEGQQQLTVTPLSTMTTTPVTPLNSSSSMSSSTTTTTTTTSSSGKNHLIQHHLQSFWQLPLESQQHFTEAVVALLREAAAMDKSSKEGERYMRTHGTGAYTGAMGSSLGADRMTGSSGVGGGSGPGGGLGGIDGGPSSADRGGGGTSIGGAGSNIGGSDRGRGDGGGGASGIAGGAADSNDSSIEERQLLSRYGIWLLIGLVDPAEANTTERVELLGRMLAMLCQWFHNTACLPDDQAGSALERIKSESIHGWLMKVIDTQFCLFANCLVPSPPDHAQIGGHWECWPSMTNQIKEGFKRLLCLVPYDIITPDIWSYIMPFWMESFRYDLAEDELSELKILLSKVLDPDLSPLGLDADIMYRFISKSFEQHLPIEQEQALSWLQILTLLEIPVPMYLLQQMFLSGIKSFQSLREMCLQQQKLEQELKYYQQQQQQQQESTSAEDGQQPQQPPPPPPPPELTQSASSLAILSSSISMENLQQSQLSCFVLMLDIIVKQFEYLPDQPGHKGFNDQKKTYQPLSLAKMSKSDSDFGFNTLVLLYEMIHTAECTHGPHTCQNSSMKHGNNNGNQQQRTTTADTSQMFKPDSILNECFFCELCSIWYQLSLQIIQLYSPIIETTVLPDMVNDYDNDNDKYIKREVKKIFRRIESSELPENSIDLLKELDDDDDINGGMDDEDEDHDHNDDDNFDETKHIEQLTLSERLTLKLLKEIPLHSDPDVLYHLLQCLKLLTLHCGVLIKMAKIDDNANASTENNENRRKFFLYCQRKYLVINLWRLLQAEFSQISQIAVPLLLHCLALPGGLAVLVRTINSEFCSTDWCVRFAAIERVSTFSQFIDQSSMKNSPSIQSALSSLFIHLIQSLDDLNSAVAQRSLTALELMRASSLKIYIMCLEMQFDLIIVDRCLVLSSLLQLFNHLNERRILTWEFFLNRFDTLFLEAQVLPIIRKQSKITAGDDNNLIDSHGRSSSIMNELNQCTRDLRNTNVHSETFKKKLQRTQESLNNLHLKRSLLLHHFNGRNEKRHLVLFVKLFAKLLRNTKSTSTGTNASTADKDFQSSSIAFNASSLSSPKHLPSMMMAMTTHKNIFNKLQSSSALTAPSTSMAISSSIDRSPFAATSSVTSTVGGQHHHRHHRNEKLKNLTGATGGFGGGPGGGGASGGGLGGGGGGSTSLNQSAINRKSSKLAALTGSAFPNNFFQDQVQNKQDMAHEELILFNVVHRIIDDASGGGGGAASADGINGYCDQETLHLLVYLFMQFLSYPDPQHPQDDKSINRTQSIVLRHLNTLLGYSMSENIFLLSAYDLRRKSIFSAFLSSLPDLLDLNLSIGSLLLPLILPILLYCPAEYRFIYVNDLDNYRATYSLWSLQPYLRRSWLSSLLIILYKHSYSSSVQYSKFVQHLIQIVQNTLESSLEHKCNLDEVARRRSREQQQKDREKEQLLKQLQAQQLQQQQQQQQSQSQQSQQQPQHSISKATPDENSADQPQTPEGAAKNIEHEPDEELEAMVMLIDKAKEAEHQHQQQQQQQKQLESQKSKQSTIQQPVIKKEIVKELDEIKVEKVKVCADVPGVPPPQQQQPKHSKSSKKSKTFDHERESSIPEAPPEESTKAFAPMVPMERLLPVGGELCETVRTNLQRRSMFPSMLQQQQPQQQTADTKDEQQSSQPTSQPHATSGNLSQQPCCCCCAAASGQVCCLNYQQTLEAFRQLPPPIQTRQQSTERLLPIGPRPHHSRSHTLTGGSRSMERSSTTTDDHQKKAKNQSKHLIRQHTTIVSTTGSIIRNEKINENNAGELKSLSSSKSMDSMDNRIAAKCLVNLSTTTATTTATQKPRLVIAKIRQTEQLELELVKKSSSIQPQQPQHQQQAATISPTSTTTAGSSPKESVTMSQGAEDNIKQPPVQPSSSSQPQPPAPSSSQPLTTAAVKSVMNQKLRKNLSPLKSASSPNLNGAQHQLQQMKSTGGQRSVIEQSNRHSNFITQTQPSSPTSKTESPSLESSISVKTIAAATTAAATTTPNAASAASAKLEKLMMGKSQLSSKQQQQQQEKKKKKSKNKAKKQHQTQQQQLPQQSSMASSLRMTSNQGSEAQTLPESSQQQHQQQSNQSQQPQTGRSNDSTNSDQSLKQQQQQYELCNCCGMPIEKFDEHELGLCLVALATFVHRNPQLAAPLLPQILKLSSRYALRCVYPWQMESNIHLPGNTASIARQFIRCTLHQLNSNGIFRQIFQTHSGDIIMFRSIAISLADFVELNQVTPLKELFEALTDDKQLPQILLTLSNVATYFECVFVDYNVTQSSSLSTLSPIISKQYGANVPVMGASIVANQPWSDLMTPLENYFRRLSFNLLDLAPNIHNLLPLMRVLLALFKIPGIGAHRSILDPVTKILSHIFQHSPILLEHVRELCIHCNRAYVRDRDRFCVARTFAQELVQALRFRTQAPDENIFALVQWSLEDAGGSLPYSIAVQSLERNQNKQLGLNGITVELPSTNATECLRCFIPELLEFICDLHALAKLRSNFQGTSIHLNQETLGGNLKAGVAQFLALELTRLSGSDSKAITKYLPWLYSLPSIQNGAKEFSECISHVRSLSWILLGSLQHTALMKCHPSQSSLLVSQPIPLDVSNHVAEHVHVILAGFGSESKSSVVHMSALFYAFLLCQLWTVYCEQLASQNPPGSDASHQNILVLTDFWTKVTPGILQIISHSVTEIPQLADTITLHFLSLMETLMECNSEILTRLLPLWLPFFNSYPGQLSDHVSARLKTLISWPIPPQTKNDAMMLSTVLIRWLQRIQARMSQIEIQSSTVTQFYCI